MNLPTLEVLEQRNLAQIKAKFPNIEPEGKGILEAMARMHASSIHLAYGMINYHMQQLFPQSATGEFLDNLLVWRPLARLTAKKAIGTAIVSGRVASVIAKGSVIAGSNGQRYQTLAEVIMNAANQVLQIKAIESGTAGNCQNEKGKWESLILGMSLSVVVNAIGGMDTESDEDYRSRALATIQRRGSLYGKQGDYATWVTDASDEIERAWEVPNFEGNGALGIVIAGNQLSRVSDGALQNAKTAIEKNGLVGIETAVVRASAKVLDFSLAIVPEAAGMRVAVQSSLHTYIAEKQRPAAQIALSKLQKYLTDNVENLNSVSIQAPTVDITSTQREILSLGRITWA